MNILRFILFLAFLLLPLRAPADSACAMWVSTQATVWPSGLHQGHLSTTSFYGLNTNFTVVQCWHNTRPAGQKTKGFCSGWYAGANGTVYRSWYTNLGTM